MNTSISLENQLLVTKFYIPIRLGSLISRPRLTSLLDESLKYPLTLVSAAAGFGKTTLLANWSQSLPSKDLRVAWVSLDEGDNEPQLFWTCILTALQKQLPERFSSLLMLLQSRQSLFLDTVLVELINVLMEGKETFVLILDDYHLITEQRVHTTLTYLIEHLPPQLRIIVSTRVDPTLPLARLRARKQVLEVCTNQLRCTSEETKAFLHEVMGLSLPEEIIFEATKRTEGWLVGLQLLGLSLPDRVDAEKLLKEISGDQRYILDYLTEEVLGRQPQGVQTFLLCTSILDEGLTASLCNALMQQTESQQMLHHLEQANLFLVSLDSKRQWYRYHALFIEALYHQLKQRHADLIPLLHHRASIWYAEHDQMIKAILHALRAKEWQWAADLIERLPLVTFTCGIGEHELAVFQHWLKQMPAEIMGARPRLCLSCSALLWTVAPHALLEAWLTAAKATITASLTRYSHADGSQSTVSSELQQEQHLLGEVLAFHAFLQSLQKDGQTALALCQQALAQVSAEISIVRVQVASAYLHVYYNSSLNDAKTAIESRLQADSLLQALGQPTLAIKIMGTTAYHLLGTGRLHEAYQLVQQAIELGKRPGELQSLDQGWPSVWQAEILREWNELDTALKRAEEGISLCKQIPSITLLGNLLFAYAVLMRIALSRGELDTAYSALQEFERLGKNASQSLYLYVRAHFLTIDQIKLWLACGELDRAVHWVEGHDLQERDNTPFGHEREEVACVRVLLATNQSNLALQRLEPVLQRATTGKRWGHVIEMRLLKALAHQMLQEEEQALDALSEAVRLAEPEGYIRCIHALCAVHYLRELTFIFEHFEQEWAKEMKTLLLSIKADVELARQRGMTSLPETTKQDFERRYKEIVQTGMAANPPSQKPPWQKEARLPKAMHLTCSSACSSIKT